MSGWRNEAAAVSNSATGAVSKSKTEADGILTKAKSDAAETVKKAEVDGKAEFLRIKETAEKEVENTRKEMREACRNNWNAALDAAAALFDGWGDTPGANAIRRLKEKTDAAE